MASDLLREKWENLRRCIARVEMACPHTFDELRTDLNAQDIIALNLERAVQVCVDIAAHIASQNAHAAPKTMSDGFNTLCPMGVLSEATTTRMLKAVGLRNIIVHEYTRVDWAIIFQVAKMHLDDFRAFAREVEAWQG